MGQFASRAKEVKNCAVINAIQDDATTIRNLQKHIQALQAQMYQQAQAQNDMNASSIQAGAAQQHNLSCAEKEKYEKKIAMLQEICRNPTMNAVDDNDAQPNDEQKDVEVGSVIKHRKSIGVNEHNKMKR